MSNALTASFEVAHFGMNCENEEDALKQAQLLGGLFGLPISEGKDSVYTGPLVELMKGGGRGKHGHIAIFTNDIHAARVLLEEMGYRFNEDSAKYDGAGNLIVIYLEMEIAGFAVHLLRK